MGTFFDLDVVKVVKPLGTQRATRIPGHLHSAQLNMQSLFQCAALREPNWRTTQQLEPSHGGMPV
jgi:hypothetical protein